MELATRVLLLRGINVGGKNLLPMKELVRMCGELGCEDIRTYIQSGNVVLRSPFQTDDALSGAVSAKIKEFGPSVPVVTRSLAELEAILAGNPYLAAGEPESTLHVMFLKATPSEERVAQLDPGRSPGDEFTMAGREVFLFCPNGLARTRLTSDYFDRTLATVGTVRNWRTVRTLAEMARE